MSNLISRIVSVVLARKFSGYRTFSISTILVAIGLDLFFGTGGFVRLVGETGLDANNPKVLAGALASLGGLAFATLRAGVKNIEVGGSKEAQAVLAEARRILKEAKKHAPKAIVLLLAPAAVLVAGCGTFGATIGNDLAGASMTLGVESDTGASAGLGLALAGQKGQVYGEMNLANGQMGGSFNLDFGVCDLRASLGMPATEACPLEE